MEILVYQLTFDDIIKLDYATIIRTIYDAIPEQTLGGELDVNETRELLAYYPALYTRMSRHWSLILEKTEARVDNKWKDLKNAYDQAIKCCKLQYETLSRRITVDKDERGMWGNHQA